MLLVGGTGVGKSSTINALFRVDPDISAENAKVGTGPDPETQVLSSYKIAKNLIVWDSPGLGESTVADISHIRELNHKLKETTASGECLIDLVLVVLDGGSRDYDSTFRLLKFITPTIKDSSRILVGINRIDMVCQGEGWDRIHNKPTEKLQKYIDEKVASVRKRIFSESKLEVKPIAYCAGRTDEGWGGTDPYQITELFCQIVSAIPDEKRIAVMERAKVEVIKASTPAQKKTIARKTESSVFPILARVGLGILTGGLSFFLGCFITSAVCTHYKKSDNCHMLSTFRHYRDNWLSKQKDGNDLIQEYYSIAPDIVRWIDSREEKEKIYEYINNQYLKKCYRMIKHKQYRQCKNLYIQMVRELQQRKSNELN